MDSIRIYGPASGTVAHDALKQLYAAGGTCNSVELVAILPERYQNSGRLKQMIENPLVKKGLARRSSCALTITSKGRSFLRQAGIGCDDKSASDSTALSAGPRPFRPINFSKLMLSMPIRPGMDDYASMPSRAGNSLIPYRR